MQPDAGLKKRRKPHGWQMYTGVHEAFCQFRQIKLKVNYATSGGQRGDITEIGEYNILK
jgi:hypothetical protein